MAGISSKKTKQQTKIGRPGPSVARCALGTVCRETLSALATTLDGLSEKPPAPEKDMSANPDVIKLPSST